jgi:hypothetical protein
MSEQALLAVGERHQPEQRRIGYDRVARFHHRRAECAMTRSISFLPRKRNVAEGV